MPALSEEGQELDDKERVGADPAAQAQADQEQAEFRNQAQSGPDKLPVAEPRRPNQPNNQPGGASSDAEAAKRSGGIGASGAGGKSGIGSPLGGGGAGGGGASAAAASLAKRQIKKRIKTGLAIGLVSAVLAIGSFFALLEDELVHIEENIVHYFDKRIEHSISQRAGSHWRKIVDKAKGRAGAGTTDTGDPIADADANFDMSEFTSTTGLKPNYNSAGDLVSFTDPAGSELSASDAALANPDSGLMEDIASHEPEGDFFREDVRSNVIDNLWGIVRKFLPSREEPASDDPTEINKEMDTNFTASEEGTNASGGEESSEETAAEDDLNTAASEATEHEDAGLGPDKAVLAICGAEGISQSIHKSLWVIRVAQLMRVSNEIILPSGHQEKDGDLHASWLAAFMKHFSGFSQSGGWQVLSGNKQAKVSDTEKAQFGAEPSGALENVTGAADKATWCNPINSALNSGGPIGSAVVIGLIDGVQVLAGPEEVGLEEALVTAGESIGINVAASQTLSYLAKVATDAASKPLLNLATATGPELVDATISGYDNNSNMNARSNGGEALTASQVAVLDNEADKADIQGAQQKGPLYAMFSPNYDRSLTSALILKVPTSADDVASGFNTAVADITEPFSPAQLASLGSFISSRIPFVNADAVSDQDDPSGWGVQQQGLPDGLLAVYPDPEANEKWVVNYLATTPDDSSAGNNQPTPLFDPGTPSSSELTGQNDAHEDLFHDFVRECLTSPNPDSSNNLTSVLSGGSDNGYQNDPACAASNSGPGNSYDRFRVYRFDLGVSNMIHSYNNGNDDQGTGGGSGSSPPTSTAGVTIDMSTLYNDSTSVACAPGTTDIGTGDGYHDKQKVEIRLCQLPNLKSSGTSVPNAGGDAVVNSRVSGAWFALVQAADQAGVNPAAISSFRTMADQQALCPCDGVTVAIPGTSNHQMGLAIDFDVGGICPSSDSSGCTAPSSATWNWLNKNASNYGIHQYPVEAWHWSPTGN